MLLPDSEEYRLLYTDEFGDDVGLDEVQLLDPPCEERVPALIEMLDSSDQYLSYQSVLILTAWGNDFGLEKLEELIDREEITNLGCSPNRITDEDNVYDELSYAVHLYGLSGGERDNVLRLFKKILAIYPKHFFESKLKHGLLKNEFVELVPFVENAIRETFAKGRFYQASQLLPVLAKLEPERGWLAVQQFTSLYDLVPDPTANVVEALKYCSKHDSQNLLQQYVSSNSPGVAEEAIKSLKYLSSK
ncbi:hypothetical protein [Vibrio nereis]|uniref:hypothetical protein n=1 Tax=Vibrio nereis TaxID=693 RepID=UPI0024949A75|nr:hypothetical protein [Vibrio nereis]